MLDFRLGIRGGDPHCWLPAPADEEEEEVVEDEVVEGEVVVGEVVELVVVVGVDCGLWDGQLIQVIVCKISIDLLGC